jgi:hypothetical protein
MNPIEYSDGGYRTCQLEGIIYGPDFHKILQ